MSSGYKNSRYGHYNSGRYKPNRYSRKQRNLIRIRNRVLIVSAGVIAVALVITLFSLFMKNCVCSGCASDNDNIIPTETIDTSATQATEKVTEPVNNLSFITPAIQDDGAVKGKEDSGLYVYKDAAYRGFKGEVSEAAAYAQVINSLNSSLGENVKVYNMLVPTHIEIGLPERLRNTNEGVETKSQAEYIKAAYEAMDNSVVPVNAYNALAQHCNDKIYFNTDYRWTGLGAYYGYTAFAESAGIQPVYLESLKKSIVDDFVGYYEMGYELGLKSESIEYWEDESYDVSVEITKTDDSKAEAYSCFYKAETSPEDKITVFLQGDYPLQVIKSNSPNAKGKICIVHESFGNPIISYFTNNYKEVYSIDMSLWTGNLKSFCKKNSIDTVLFIHDTASSATEETQDQLKDMVK